MSIKVNLVDVFWINQFIFAWKTIFRYSAWKRVSFILLLNFFKYKKWDIRSIILAQSNACYFGMFITIRFKQFLDLTRILQSNSNRIENVLYTAFAVTMNFFGSRLIVTKRPWLGGFNLSQNLFSTRGPQFWLSSILSFILKSIYYSFKQT